MTKIDKKIIHLYRSGLSGTKIANRLKITRYKVYSVLERNQETRTNKENYALSFNDRYFKVINTERKAYFLGLLMADGSIIQPKNSSKVTKLELKREDKKVIEELTTSLGLHKERLKEYIYGPKPDQISSRLLVPSDILAHDLKQHGIHPRKTFLVKFPNLNENLKRHFIRGYFDGDGCITTGPTVKIIGTIALLQEIEKCFNKYCETKTGHKLYDRYKNGNNIRCLEIGGIYQVKRIFEYLYKNSSVFLERKKNRFLELL